MVFNYNMNMKGKRMVLLSLFLLMEVDGNVQFYQSVRIK